MAGKRGFVVRGIRQRLYPPASSPRQKYLYEVRRLAHRAQRILDIGCGHAAPDLESLNGTAGLKVGIDLDPDLRPDDAPSVRFVVGNASRLPFDDDAFDLVISRSVLEHLEDPPSVFSEISRVLKPDGTFLVITPNRWDYVSLLSSLVPNSLHPLIVKRLTARALEDTYPTRYRANTRRALRRLALNNGLRPVSIQLLREHPHYLQLTSATYLLGIAFEQTFQRCLPLLRPWILALFRRDGQKAC